MTFGIGITVLWLLVGAVKLKHCYGNMIIDDDLI
jgi:hypothetical protein